jgi:CheY-like chemotaxis protein
MTGGREQRRDASESVQTWMSAESSSSRIVHGEREETGVLRAPKSLRIVVVDDHEDTATMMSALLRMAGHEVESAHDGRTAVITVGRFKPDVVLLDLGLPDMDGCEIARQLRQMPDGKALLLIALTGYAESEHIAATREAGFDHHLTKPVDLNSVRRLLACARRA